MKKTGSFILVYILALSLIPLFAQSRDDISVTASVSNTIFYVGEQFALSVEVSGASMRSLDRPDLPTINGLTFASRVPSTSSSISVVNGVTTATYGFRYILRGDQVGTYTIPSFTFVIDGRTHETNPIDIQIVRRDQQQQRAEAPEIYLQLELSTDRPYVGQQVTAKIVLYFRNDIDILSYNPISAWRTEGFWLHNLNEEGGAPRAESVLIRGVRYRKAELSSFALFPTRAGTLNIGAYSIRANVRFSGRYDDATQRFFSGFGRTQRNIELSSEAKEITVRRLPTPQPDGYLGAVGSFSIKRDISAKDISLGEPVEIVTRIEGRGNISLINHPKYDLPEAFEQFQPQENINLRSGAAGVSGTKTFTDVLIARQTGSFEVPAQAVSWFDPGTGRYVNQMLPAIPVTIRRDLSQVAGRVEESRLNLRPVVGITVWRALQSDSPYKAWWFWVLALLPLIIFLGGYYQKNRLHKLQFDKAFYRYTHAEDSALATLDAAEQHAQNDRWRDAYGLLHRSLAVFIADRLNLPDTGHSDSELAQVIQEKSGDDDVSKQVKMQLSKYSTIQYAPESMIESFDGDVKATRELIRKIKKIS